MNKLKEETKINSKDYYLTPKNDVVFKRLFGKKGNERLIKDFLEAVLDTKIERVELGLETQLVPDKIDEKLGILDVRVNLSNGTVVDVEMQNVNYKDIPKRMTYYLNQLYIGELTKGKTYNELNKAIAIGILDFNYFEDIEEYHTIWKMTEQKNKEKTLEEQEIHFIELPKFLKSKVNTDRKLDQWLLFIDYSRKELIKMAEDKNEMIKEAVTEYEYLTGEEDLQRIAFLKRKYELDYNTGIEDAEERGMKRGMERGMKRGMEQGMKRGMEQGMERGIERGMKKGTENGKKIEKIEIAKKMLKMKVDKNIISEVTGLSVEEINDLK